MDQENFESALEVGQIDLHFSIEPAWPHQRGVKNLFPVGGTHHNHLIVAFEPVHLDQQLVQSALSLVIASDVVRALFSYRI